MEAFQGLPPKARTRPENINDLGPRSSTLACGRRLAQPVDLAPSLRFDPVPSHLACPEDTGRSSTLGRGAGGGDLQI
eukprot:2329967-Pyramimonas_sp.AAC.1